MKVLNLSFYKFVDLSPPIELPELRKVLRQKAQELGIKGTILLSLEGLNAFLAGPEEPIRAFVAFLREFPPFADIVPKESWSDRVPFGKMLVKLKKEIIPMGRPDVQPARWTGPRLLPSELKKWLDEGREVLLLDTRNEYEIEFGTFENAVDLKLKHFRNFPERLKEAAQTRPELLEKPVVMFCTGGIRCEKATAVALNDGFKNVYQLEGGILKYFEECGKAHYRGDCFVFDERVALDPSLAERKS